MKKHEHVDANHSYTTLGNLMENTTYDITIHGYLGCLGKSNQSVAVSITTGKWCIILWHANGQNSTVDIHMYLT